MSDEWPELPEECKKDVQRLIAAARNGIIDAAEQALSSIYQDIAPFIESDLQQNWRSKLSSALEWRCIRGIAETSAEVWAQNVRQRIFETHREELEKGLIADLTKERDRWKAWYHERNGIR